MVDDDPTPALTVGSATAVEGSEFLEFPLKLAEPSDRFVSLEGELTDGTAVLGRDFAGETSDPPARWLFGYVEPGKTTGTMVVRVLDDKVREPTETFTGVLTTARGGEIKLPVTLTGTIRDND